MAFGGLGIIMFSGRSALWSLNMALRKVDLQSLFFASMFTIILVVLAYLTNPSETSFRTYLTEQTFRQHLRRLDDENHEDGSDREDSGVHYSLSRRSPQGQSARSYDSNPPFHFVNRAAVSLRTPKHVFHSFGILTFAAIVPTGSRSQSFHDGHTRLESPASMLSDSWFIGAFGRWWRVGALQSWWLGTMANAKDAERCNSGVLDVKTLDSLEGFDGLPFNITSPTSPLCGSASRDLVRLRDSSRSTSQKITNNSPRSSSPPPLPKSATLPLHVPRVPASTSTAKGSKPSTQRPAPITSQPPTAGPPQSQNSSVSLFDQSPIIAEILRQISVSEAAVYDLRNQLTDFRSSATRSRSSIQNELDVQREKKRTEDATRVELKTRTKALEDSKRSAETSKREAEKKLRVAEHARDGANERMGRLDREISALKERMSDDKRAVVASKDEADEIEQELTEKLELKRKEIKVTEDVVAALSARAKELEEKIASEEDRLAKTKEQAELRKQDRDFFPLHVVPSDEGMGPSADNSWSPTLSDPSPPQDPHSFINTDDAEQIEVFTQSLHVPRTRSRGRSGSSSSRETSDYSTSPRLRKLSLGVMSNFLEKNGSLASEVSASKSDPQAVSRPPNGFSFDANILAPTQSTRFAPFGENDTDGPAGMMNDFGAPSPKSSSLIPTNLMQSLEAAGGAEDLSRSFQSDTDDFLDREWRKMHPFPLQAVESPAAAFSSSPTSVSHPSFDEIDTEDIFKVRPPPLRQRITTDEIDLPNVFNPIRSSTDPLVLTRSRTRESDEEKHVVGHRRWFSSPKEQKDKKGLNPEAKAFQLSKPFTLHNMFHSSGPKRGSIFDNIVAPPSASLSSAAATSMTTSLSVPVNLLPPLSSSSTTTSSSSTMDSFFSTLSMRAFAPSPAEREALTRALGSSTNTSLERLPTLSEVSIPSIPSSPSAHANAIAAQHTHAPINVASGDAGARPCLPPGLAWLQAFPRMRKPKFSPWDDEPSSGDLVVEVNATESQL